MDTKARQTTQTLRRSIAKAEQGLFLEVPFLVPEGVDEIAVGMKVSSAAEAEPVIDLGVKDPARVRGWSGGARRAFTIGQDNATPGYLPGPIPTGQWAVLLGAYHVPDAGCEIELTIRCLFHSPRWLKGDLHGHSVHSDGQYTLAQIADIVESLGLDFMGLMDHNTCSQNHAYPTDSSVIFIPGMELTTYRGHCNLFGVPDPVDDFRVLNREMLAERIATARARGAYVSLNHPHDTSCPSCSWQWGWDVSYDWVEVWNGPWRESNQRALEWWHQQLTSGRRLVAVGGSDVHRPHPSIRHGWPTTWVKSESRSARGILRAIDQGRVFISYAPDGPTAELSCGSFMMGDVVPQETGQMVELNLSGLQEGDVVRIISERGEESTRTVRERETELSLNWPVHGRHFFRAEVWRYFDVANQLLPAVLTNPIYFA